MMINVTEVSRCNSHGTDYVFVTMEAGKHEACVIVASGMSPHVNVTVKNAAQRCWKGLGRRFSDAASAVAAYKTDAIRRMIETACEIAAA